MNYTKTNTYLGWFIFLLATAVYFITIEDTVSLWDCGEYITAAYKLEVGHPPGAPLFMVLGRLFSFFADLESVAVWMNRLSGISSSFTILFMFWSLTMLIRKMMKKAKDDLSIGEKIAIFGSAVIGSMAYAFTESFWFSAVEGEVYAMASLFTAVIFWAILKWDDEMIEIQTGRLNPTFSPDRWLLAIMFMLGLAIGVHLLGILVVPTITFVIYFRYAKKVNLTGILLIGLLSVVILGFIQEGVIPGSIAIASKFEISFVNSIGLPFYSGTIVFFLLLIGIIIFIQRYARKKGNRFLYSSIMGLALLLIGYGSFAVIVIRSNANTPLDENDPENLVTLHSYLKREQYGSAPIASGQFWNSEYADRSEWKDNSPIMLRRFVVVKNDNDIKAFKDEERAIDFANKEGGGAEVIEKYYETNANNRKNAKPAYAQTTLFPRMYLGSGQPGAESKINRYKYWSDYDASEDKGTEIGSDGNRLPTMGENLTYFGKYQMNWMYWRYFMWNFAGRQNDIQGHGDAIRGNWISGLSFIDNARLGDSGENAPYFTNENPSYNKFFLLPLIFGIIGLVFHYYKSPKDAFVLTLAFLFTGIAIVVYLNQKPYEPRERDYAYAGSFYFFAMWIGIGVYGLFEAFRSIKMSDFKKLGTILAGFIFTVVLLTLGTDFSNANFLMWLFMIVAIIGLFVLMFFLGKGMKNNDKNGAIIASLLGLIVPIILGSQGWDDHDRSEKTSARDLASNYLKSCGIKKNGILFTNGDNDTFPLWYMQEVEGKFTDVRVCNLSLMQTDWYTDQMKMKAYESEPLPIKFTEDQIMMNAGKTDMVYFIDLFSIFGSGGNNKLAKKIIDLRVKSNPVLAKNTMILLASSVSPFLDKMTPTRNAEAKLLEKAKMINASIDTVNVANNLFRKYQAYAQTIATVQNGGLKGDQNSMQQFLDIVRKSSKNWNRIELIDAMEFVRDDNNLFNGDQGQKIRIFPTKAFKLKVNKENAVKSGIITKAQKKDCLDELNFDFESSNILTREQVMMLDVIANNDWKRGIYFSSPGASDVSRAIYGRGYMKQNGLAVEISPLNSIGKIYNKEKMYDNMINNYSYGNMSNPDVLTDYYTRRHTNQYRMHFLNLANEYISDALQAEFSPQGRNETKETKETKQKAINLLKHSLKVMPADVVIDWSDPRAGKPYKYMGQEIPSQQDGILHDYVEAFFMAGNKKEALKLGEEVERQLWSIINFYDKSETEAVFSPADTKDLFAALDGYMKLAGSVSDNRFGVPTSPLAKKIEKQVNYIYNKMVPRVKDELKNLALENGENVRRGASGGKFSGYLQNFDMYTTAIGENFGILEKTPTTPSPSPSTPTMNNVPAFNPVGQ